MQSVPITTKVVSSNPVHGEVYSLQHYVIQFYCDLRRVGGYLRLLRFHPPIKLHDTTEILLKVALHTTNQPTETTSTLNVKTCNNSRVLSGNLFFIIVLRGVNKKCFGGEKSVCHKWVSIIWFLVLAFPEPWLIY